MNDWQLTTAAVNRLLALHVQIANGDARAADQVDVFREAYDVVRWLPDLAADSDLEEQSSNRVRHVARRLETILVEVQSYNDSERQDAFFGYETELDRHYRELIEINRQLPNARSSLVVGEQEQASRAFSRRESTNSKPRRNKVRDYGEPPRHCNLWFGSRQHRRLCLWPWRSL